MAEDDLQGLRQIPRQRIAGSKMRGVTLERRRLRNGQFDPIAEALEFSDHSGRPVSLGLLADCWASFLVPDAVVQNLPDQAAKPVGDHADRLVVLWHRGSWAASV
jgi:hypothetical protein